MDFVNSLSVISSKIFAHRRTELLFVPRTSFGMMILADVSISNGMSRNDEIIRQVSDMRRLRKNNKKLALQLCDQDSFYSVSSVSYRIPINSVVRFPFTLQTPFTHTPLFMGIILTRTCIMGIILTNQINNQQIPSNIILSYTFTFIVYKFPRIKLYI